MTTACRCAAALFRRDAADQGLGPANCTLSVGLIVRKIHGFCILGAPMLLPFHVACPIESPLIYGKTITQFSPQNGGDPVGEINGQVPTMIVHISTPDYAGLAFISGIAYLIIDTAYTVKPFHAGGWMKETDTAIRDYVTKPKIFDEAIHFRARAGTKARIDALRGGMRQGDFVRLLLEEALERRENDAPSAKRASINPPQ